MSIRTLPFCLSPDCHCVRVSHLAPHTVYEFRVQAETAVGPGPFSDSRQFTTPEDGMIIVVSTTAWLSEFIITISCINYHTYL